MLSMGETAGAHPHPQKFSSIMSPHPKKHKKKQSAGPPAEYLRAAPASPETPPGVARDVSAGYPIDDSPADEPTATLPFRPGSLEEPPVYETFEAAPLAPLQPPQMAYPVRPSPPPMEPRVAGTNSWDVLLYTVSGLMFIYILDMFVILGRQSRHGMHGHDGRRPVYAGGGYGPGRRRKI